MPKKLAEVLAAEKDEDVCNGLYFLMVARYGKHIDPTTLSAEQRTAFLVWHTNTLIGNGGFNGYFKSDPPGDPQYVHMQAAYEAIGCEPAAAAVRRVFDSFTNRIPPTDPSDRLRAFVRANNAVQGALNRDYYKAGKELTTAVANYIRKNAAAFADIEKPPEPYSIANAPPPKPVAAPAPSDSSIENGIAKLPHWARAAFYANCARVVLPLWENAWPDSPTEFQQGVEQAVLLAELCAAQGEAVGDQKTAASLAVQAAEAAAAADPKKRMGGAPPADPVTAVNIAVTAACALDFIAGDAEADAYEFAKSAVESAGRLDLIEMVQEHFSQVKRLAREAGWTDKTPVPPEVFRPDFESRGKSWWKRW